MARAQTRSRGAAVDLGGRWILVSAALAALLTALLAAIILATAAPALAHEGKEVGDIELIVGWNVEPAYSGQQNRVELAVVHADDGDPVTRPAEALKVAVKYGDQRIDLPLEPAGAPGEYYAGIIPTAPGDYTFRITGTIAGEKVDESFTSGPDTFSPVLDPESVQFPVKTPDMTQVAQRLESQTSRFATAAALEQAKDEASSARTLGIVGIALGALGAAVGGVALVRKKA